MELNLYPVKTKVDARVVRNLRLRSTDRGTVIWRFDRDSGEVRELVRTDEVAQRVGATQSWRVGDHLIEPQRGCGCNHPMYTWVPPADA